MIFRGAGKIAQQLWLSEIISEDERELYQYAIFSIMSTIIPLIMVMIIGGIFPARRTDRGFRQAWTDRLL